MSENVHPVVVSLIMDEISLKEHIYFDNNHTFHGGVDLGDVGVLGSPPDDPGEIQVAKQALGMKMILVIKSTKLAVYFIPNYFVY